VAIFGRLSARQRLRRAAQESLAIPAFSSPVDCTPWVIGGLWPAELSTVTPETATVADHLRDDLQRIARIANDELRIIRRAGMSDPVRQAEEARLIARARGHAVRRVESALRHLHTMPAGAPVPPARPPAVQHSVGTDIDKTQVIPAVRDSESPLEPPEPPAAPAESTVRPEVAVGSDVPEPVENSDHAPEPVESTAYPDAPPANEEPETAGQHRAEVVDSYQPEVPDDAMPPDVPVLGSYEPEVPQSAVRADALAVDSYEPVPPVGPPPDPGLQIPPVIPAAAPGPQPEPRPEPKPVPSVYASPAPAIDGGSDGERLRRLLAFVVRQEPRLNWAVADYADGRTVLVTDLAHGWIPAGIALPAGVRLLEPERRAGNVSALLGATARVVSYTPGDSLDWSAEFTETGPSVLPRELPPVDDLGWELGHATHWRDGLPRMVHTLARAAAAGTGIVDDEVDLLRVHLDTAHHQLLAQYPSVDPVLLLNCQLLAATEGIVSGDPTTANYHLSWFQKLSAPPAGRWDARP
jgi:Family of unknown function (DUF5631)/Family of unknown function (DUF5632)